MKKKKILWIALSAPYQRIKHAGGQNLCHLVSEIDKSNLFDMDFICLCFDEEKEDIDKSLICKKEKITLVNEASRLKTKIVNFESRKNPYNRYGNYLSNTRAGSLKREIKKYKKNNPSPDIVILHWTEIVVLANWVKSIFPNSAVICIEEDVAYLKRKRLSDTKTGGLKEYYNKMYQKGKSVELSALEKADLIITNNYKDTALLISDGIEEKKIYTSCVYYNSMLNVSRKRENQDIIFWGSLGRKENYESAIWFINKVMPKIEDLRTRFVIIGANPPDILLKYRSEKVVITGFVDDPVPFFCKSMCMVAPLQMGAGIKVKVLEGLSSGIPVITNSIGIEGIPAIDGEHYIHAESADDFAAAIRTVISYSENQEQKISEEAKRLITQKFSFYQSTVRLIKILETV